MAASDMERLVVSMEARTTAFERALSKALSDTNKNASGIERRVTAMQRRVEGSFSGLQKVGGVGMNLAGGLVGGVSLGALVKATDAYRGLTNQLTVAGLEGDGLKAVYDQLAASAQRNYAPLASLVSLYSKASQAQSDLGASQADLLGFTDNVAKALRVAGATPESASGALLQLGQLLGSARVQAEEFNSVNEGARPILQAVADGIEEAGGSVSKLKALVNDGEISNKAFFEGFMAGARNLDAKLEGTSVTVSGALENLKTTLTTLAGRFDEGSKSTDAFVTAIGDVQRAVVELADFIEDGAGGLAAFGKWLEETRDKAMATAEAVGRLTGLDRVGKPINQALGTADYTQMSDALDTTGGSAEALEAELKRLTGEAERLSSNRLTLETSRLKEVREEIKKTRASIEALRGAAAGAGSVDVSKAIIAATPTADLPPVNVPALPAARKPISLKDYPVEGAKASNPKIEGLAKSFGDSLAQMIAAAKSAGHDITVFSGKRTVERQQELWAAAVAKYGSEDAARKWVAPPGKSMHNAGKAADLRYGDDAAKLWAHQNASSFGLSFPLGNEPWHIEPTGARGGRGSRNTAATEADEKAAAVQRVIASLTAETEAVGKNREQRELLQALKEAGVEADSAEGRAIAEKVQNLYALRDADEAAAESAAELKRAREQFAEMGADAVKGIVSDLRAGKSAADAFKNALDRILTTLANNAIDSIIKGLLAGPGKGGGGGLLGGIFGFAEGGVMTPSGPRHLSRYASGGVSDKAAIFGEAGPEAAVPLPDGRRIPVNLRMPAIGKNKPIPRASNTLNLRTTIDLTGANGDDTIRRIAREQAEAGVASGLRAYDRNFKNRVDYMQTHEV